MWLENTFRTSISTISNARASFYVENVTILILTWIIYVFSWCCTLRGSGCMIIIVCHPLQHSTVKLSVLCWSQCPAWPGMLRAHCHATTARTHTLPASQSVVWRSWSQAPATLQHNIEKYLKSTNKGGDTWPKTTSYSVHHLLQPQEQCQVGLTIIINSKYAKFWRNHKRITCLISVERWPFTSYDCDSFICYCYSVSVKTWWKC